MDSKGQNEDDEGEYHQSLPIESGQPLQPHPRRVQEVEQRRRNCGERDDFLPRGALYRKATSSHSLMPAAAFRKA